jgi:hypothetical protein
MISPSSRRRRLVPMLLSLEPRRLLSMVVTSNGQDGHGFVGPNASPGGVGIQNLDLSLSNLSYATSQIEYITVTAPGGFEWQTAPTPAATRLPSFFPV